MCYLQFSERSQIRTDTVYPLQILEMDVNVLNMQDNVIWTAVHYSNPAVIGHSAFWGGY